MNASLLAVLNDAERQLVAETERARLAELDEDAAIELETRIRRTRNKYVGQYRRGASSAVPEHGGRGRARPENKRAALKAEAFEETLSRVSRRVAALARQAAAQLRAERIAAARAVKSGRGPGRAGAAGAAPGRTGAGRTGAGRTGAGRTGAGRTGAASGTGPAVSGQPAGDRALRSPASEKRRAGTLAQGARRQAKRDSR
jgi:hypothetical protein